MKLTKTIKDKSQIAFDKLAKGYDKTFEGNFTLKFNQALAEIIELGENARVLDTACGNGRLLSMLEDKYPEAEFFGTDISENMIEQAQKLHSDFTFRKASCYRLPFEDYSFDAVIICCALHHLVNPLRFFREAARVLKPDGKLWIADVNLPAGVRSIANLYLPLSGKGDYKIYNLSEILKLLNKAGFNYNYATSTATGQFITGAKASSSDITKEY